VQLPNVAAPRRHAPLQGSPVPVQLPELPGPAADGGPSAVPGSVPRRGGAWTRGIGRLGLYLLGWRVEGCFPDHPKLVIAGAPHSTNWDFPVAMSVAFAYNLRINFLAKHRLFKGALGPVMRWFGGVSVDRGMAADVVEQVVESFAACEAMWLCIAPEGTRKQVDRFRSGFLRIAAGAEIPILLLVFDHGARAIRLGPLCLPGPDPERDREVIELWYRPYQVMRKA